MRFHRSVPSAALSDMYAHDQKLGIDPVSYVAAPAPPHPGPDGGLRIEPADWDEELRDRARQERQREERERDRLVAEELERIAPEDQEPNPYPAKRRWRRSPT